MAATKLSREDWLASVAAGMEGWFKPLGVKVPKYRVTCGFPSKSALARKQKRIGECWSPDASTGGVAEISVSPLLDDPIEVAQVLCHEMLHAFVGVEAGHKGPFVKGCKLLGLEGKPTATVAGPLFTANVRPILKAVGKYPHKRMDPTIGEKKQTTRMLKVVCAESVNEGEPFIVRMSAKALDIGVPTCPCHGEPMEAAAA